MPLRAHKCAGGFFATMTLTRRTPEKEAELLALITAGDYVSVAAEKCGIARQTVYDWKYADEAFAQRLADAQKRGDEVQVERLEIEADRRARDGIDKGIYYEGVRVAVERQYSDTLMMFRLKAKRPDLYRERHEHSSDPNAPFVPSINITVIQPEPTAAPKASNGTKQPSD